MATITYNGITYTYNTNADGTAIGNPFVVQMSGTGTAYLAGCTYELNGNTIVIDVSDYLASKYAALGIEVNFNSNPVYSSEDIMLPIANTTIDVTVNFGAMYRPYNRMPVCLPRIMEIPTTAGLNSVIYFDTGSYVSVFNSGAQTILKTCTTPAISTNVKFLRYSNGVFTRVTKPRLVPVCELQNKVLITWVDICGRKKQYMFDMGKLEYAIDDVVDLYAKLYVSHGNTSPGLGSRGIHGTRSINLSVIARKLLPYERYYLMDLAVSPTVDIRIYDEFNISTGNSAWIYYGIPTGDASEVDFSDEVEEDIEFSFIGYPINYY